MRRNHTSRNGQNTVGLSVINHASTLDGKYQQGREIPCHFPAYTLEKILSLNLTYRKEKSSSRFLAKQKNKSDDLPSMHDIMRRL